MLASVLIVQQKYYTTAVFIQYFVATVNIFLLEIVNSYKLYT